MTPTAPITGAFLVLSQTALFMTTTTLSRPFTTQSSGTGSNADVSVLRQPADLSHLSDEAFIEHLRRYERESVFIEGLVSSVTIVPDHQSVTGYGFVVVRVLVNGKAYTLIDWPRNEFYHHLCALNKSQRIGWIVAPIDWNQSEQYPFMRDHFGTPYSQFYRGSKIVDLDLYNKSRTSINTEYTRIEQQFKAHSRLLNGKTVSLPKGYIRARAIEACLESASHRFKHVTNDPVAFFPEGI
jgi:hypothetical protein